MRPTTWTQPTLYGPEGDAAPDLKVELTIYLSHDRTTTEIWHRITHQRTGQMVGAGNVYVSNGHDRLTEACQVASAVMHAALELHGPF